MVIKTSDNRTVSVAKINGYTYEKVMKAKKYLEEIGSNRRNFPFDKLVTYYNDVYGTNERASGCKCQAPKYYNGLQNYFNYGKLTLINNGLATEEDFEDKKEETPAPIENAENRINLGTEPISAPSVNDNSLETQNEATDDVSDDKVNNDKVEEKEVVTEEKKKAGRPKKVKE